MPSRWRGGVLVGECVLVVYGSARNDGINLISFAFIYAHWEWTIYIIFPFLAVLERKMISSCQAPAQRRRYLRTWKRRHDWCQATWLAWLLSWLARAHVNEAARRAVDGGGGNGDGHEDGVKGLR
jgi:hypothetical protein